MSRRKKKPHHGKVRRAPELTKVRSVCIDPTAEAFLKSYFKTLGNALYHLYVGLSQHQNFAAARLILKPAPSADYVPPLPPLSEEDWTLLSETIQAEADRRNQEVELTKIGTLRAKPSAGQRHAQALEAALRRLELALGRPAREDPVRTQEGDRPAPPPPPRPA